MTTAGELKYTNELKRLLQQEFSSPSSKFVKFFAKQIYPTNVTTKVLELFTGLMKKSLQQYISDLVTERLNVALNKEEEVRREQNQDLDSTNIKSSSGIETTAPELDGFMVVKAILRQKIDISRIYYRDAHTYFAVLLDDNNRKTVCRLYFNETKMRLAILDSSKKEVKYDLTSVDDIFKFSEDKE